MKNRNKINFVDCEENTVKIKSVETNFTVVNTILKQLAITADRQ